MTQERIGGFPKVRDAQDFAPERLERVGDRPSAFRDERTRRFLREADLAMGALLHGRPRPLYVTGEPAALSLLSGAGGVTADAVRIPHGGLAHGTPDAVWQAVRPVLEAGDRRSTEEVTRALASARGRRTFAAGVDELWRSAREGRVRLLAVEENHRVTARVTGGHLVVAEGGDPDAREDVVDEVVEQCLRTGAEVRFVPDGALGDAGGIAGVLRH